MNVFITSVFFIFHVFNVFLNFRSGQVLELNVVIITDDYLTHYFSYFYFYPFFLQRSSYALYGQVRGAGRRGRRSTGWRAATSQGTQAAATAGSAGRRRWRRERGC